MVNAYGTLTFRGPLVRECSRDAGADDGKQVASQTFEHHTECIECDGNCSVGKFRSGRVSRDACSRVAYPAALNIFRHG